MPDSRGSFLGGKEDKVIDRGRDGVERRVGSSVEVVADSLF